MKLLCSVFVISVASLFTGHAQAEPAKIKQCRNWSQIYRAITDARDGGVSEDDAALAVARGNGGAAGTAFGYEVVRQVYETPGAQSRTSDEIAKIAFDGCMATQ
jgi:hypothetical protein